MICMFSMLILFKLGFYPSAVIDSPEHFADYISYHPIIISSIPVCILFGICFKIVRKENIRKLLNHIANITIHTLLGVNLVLLITCQITKNRYEIEHIVGEIGRDSKQAIIEESIIYKISSLCICSLSLIEFLALLYIILYNRGILLQNTRTEHMNTLILYILYIFLLLIILLPNIILIMGHTSVIPFFVYILYIYSLMEVYIYILTKNVNIVLPMSVIIALFFNQSIYFSFGDSQMIKDYRLLVVGADAPYFEYLLLQGVQRYFPLIFLGVFLLFLILYNSNINSEYSVDYHVIGGLFYIILYYIYIYI